MLVFEQRCRWYEVAMNDNDLLFAEQCLQFPHDEINMMRNACKFFKCLLTTDLKPLRSAMRTSTWDSDDKGCRAKKRKVFTSNFNVIAVCLKDFFNPVKTDVWHQDACEVSDMCALYCMYLILGNNYFHSSSLSYTAFVTLGFQSKKNLQIKTAALRRKVKMSVKQRR